MSESVKGSRTFHLRIDLRGALRNWHDREWKNCVRDETGHVMTPYEVREEFLNLLAKGKKFVACGECDKFDDERGCLGHSTEEMQKEGEL